MSSCKAPNCELKNFNGCSNSLTFCDISGDINNEISVATCMPKDSEVGIIKRDLTECNVPLTSENPQFECEGKIGCEWGYPVVISGNNLLEKQCNPMKDILGEIKPYTCGSSPSSGIHESSFTTNNDLARRSLKEKETFGCPKDKCNYTQVKKTRENGECSPTGSDNIINEATGQKCGDLSTRDICLTYPNCRWEPKDEEHCGLKRLFYQDLQVSDEKCKSIQAPSEENCKYWGCIWDIYGDRGENNNYDKNTSGICVAPTNDECMKNFCSKNTQKVGGGLRNSFHPDGLCSYIGQVGDNTCSPSNFEIVGSKTPGLMEIPGGNTDVENAEIRDLKASISNQQEVIKSDQGDIDDKRSRLNNYIDDLYRSSCEIRGEYTTDTKIYSKNTYDYGSYECVGDNVEGSITNSDRNINNICSGMKEGNNSYYRKNWPSLDANENVEKIDTFGTDGLPNDFITIRTGERMYHGLTFGSQGSETGRCINKYSADSDKYIFDCASITERNECNGTHAEDGDSSTLKCEWYEPNERCKLNMDKLIDTFDEHSPTSENLWDKIRNYYPGGYCTYDNGVSARKKVYRFININGMDEDLTSHAVGGGTFANDELTTPIIRMGGPFDTSKYTYLNDGRKFILRKGVAGDYSETDDYRICYKVETDTSGNRKPIYISGDDPDGYNGGEIYCFNSITYDGESNIASGVLDSDNNITWTNGPTAAPTCTPTASGSIDREEKLACAIHLDGHNLDTVDGRALAKTACDDDVNCTYTEPTGTLSILNVYNEPSSFKGTIGDMYDKDIIDGVFFMKPPSMSVDGLGHSCEFGCHETGHGPNPDQARWNNNYFIRDVNDNSKYKKVLLTLDDKASKIHGEYNNMNIELSGNVNNIKGEIEYYGGGGTKYVFVNWKTFNNNDGVKIPVPESKDYYMLQSGANSLEAATTDEGYEIPDEKIFKIMKKDATRLPEDNSLVGWKILFFKDNINGMPGNVPSICTPRNRTGLDDPTVGCFDGSGDSKSKSECGVNSASGWEPGQYSHTTQTYFRKNCILRDGGRMGPASRAAGIEICPIEASFTDPSCINEHGAKIVGAHIYHHYGDPERVADSQEPDIGISQELIGIYEITGNTVGGGNEVTFTVTTNSAKFRDIVVIEEENNDKIRNFKLIPPIDTTHTKYRIWPNLAGASASSSGTYKLYPNISTGTLISINDGTEKAEFEANSGGDIEYYKETVNQAVFLHNKEDTLRHTQIQCDGATAENADNYKWESNVNTHGKALQSLRKEHECNNLFNEVYNTIRDKVNNHKHKMKITTKQPETYSFLISVLNDIHDENTSNQLDPNNRLNGWNIEFKDIIFPLDSNFNNVCKHSRKKDFDDCRLNKDMCIYDENCIWGGLSGEHTGSEEYASGTCVTDTHNTFNSVNECPFINCINTCIPNDDNVCEECSEQVNNKGSCELSGECSYTPAVEAMDTNGLISAFDPASAQNPPANLTVVLEGEDKSIKVGDKLKIANKDSNTCDLLLEEQDGSTVTDNIITVSSIINNRLTFNNVKSSSSTGDVQSGQCKVERDPADRPEPTCVSNKVEGRGDSCENLAYSSGFCSPEFGCIPIAPAAPIQPTCTGTATDTGVVCDADFATEVGHLRSACPAGCDYNDTVDPPTCTGTATDTGATSDCAAAFATARDGLTKKSFAAACPDGCDLVLGVAAVVDACIPLDCSEQTPMTVEYSEPNCMSKENYSNRMLCKYSDEILRIYGQNPITDNFINNVSIYLAQKTILAPKHNAYTTVRAPIEETFPNGIFPECIAITDEDKCADQVNKTSCEDKKCMWDKIDRLCRIKNNKECRVINNSNCADNGCKENDNILWNKGHFKEGGFDCKEVGGDCSNKYWKGERIGGGWRKPWGSTERAHSDEYGKRINIDGILNGKTIKASGIANIIGRNIYVDWDNEQLEPITANDNVKYSLEDIDTKGIDSSCIYDDNNGKYRVYSAISVNNNNNNNTINNLYENLLENLPSKVNTQNQITDDCEADHSICSRLPESECEQEPYNDMCEWVDGDTPAECQGTNDGVAACTGTNDGVAACTTTPVAACAAATADQATCEGAGSCTWDNGTCTTTDQDTECNAAMDEAACEVAGAAPGDCTYSPGAACALNDDGSGCAVDSGDCSYSSTGSPCALNGDGSACEVQGGNCIYMPAITENTCRTKSEKKNICPDDTLLWEGGQWNHILNEDSENIHTITDMVYNTGKATVIVGLYTDSSPSVKEDDIFSDINKERILKGYENGTRVKFREISTLSPDDRLLKNMEDYDCSIKVHSNNTIEVEIDNIDPGDIDEYIFTEFKYEMRVIDGDRVGGTNFPDIVFAVEYIRFHDITMDIYLDMDIRPLYKKNDIINIKKLKSDGSTINTKFTELFNPYILFKDGEVYTKIIDTDYKQNRITVNNITRKDSGPYFPGRHDINNPSRLEEALCITKMRETGSSSNYTPGDTTYCGYPSNDIQTCYEDDNCNLPDSISNPHNKPCSIISLNGEHKLEFSYCQNTADTFQYYSPSSINIPLAKATPPTNNIYNLNTLFESGVWSELNNHKDKTNFSLEGCIIRYIINGNSDFSEKYGYIQNYKEDYTNEAGETFTGCKISTPTRDDETRNEENDDLTLLSIDFRVANYKKIDQTTQKIKIKPYKRKDIDVLPYYRYRKGDWLTREYFNGINSKDICDFNNGIWEDFNCRTHGYSLNNLDICEKNGLLWKSESNICVKELSNDNEYYKIDDDDLNYCSRKTDSVKNTEKEELPPNIPCPSCNYTISNEIIECKKKEERDCMKKNEINCNLDSGCEYYKDMMEPSNNSLPSQAVFNCASKEGVTSNNSTCSANTDISSCEEDNCEWQCPFTPNSRNQSGYKVTKSIDGSPLTTTLNSLTSDYYSPSDLSVECNTGWERYPAVDLKANCVENIDSDSRTESHTYRIELAGCRKTIHCSDNILNGSVLNESLLSEMEIDHVPNEFTKVVGNNKELDLTKTPTNNGEYPCSSPKELVGEPNDKVGWSEEVCCIGQGLCSGNTDSTKDITCPSGQVLKKVYYGESTELLSAKGTTVAECCVVPGAPTVTIPLDADYEEIAGSEGSVQRDAFEENFRTDILGILNTSEHINTTITSEMIEILNVGEGSIIVTFKVNKDTTGNVILEEQITKAISPGTSFTSVGAVSNAAPSYKPYDPKSKYFYWSDSLKAGITLDQLITAIFLVICILSSSFAVFALLLK